MRQGSERESVLSMADLVFLEPALIPRAGRRLSFLCVGRGYWPMRTDYQCYCIDIERGSLELTYLD
jgi:hypothetical protein